MAWRQPGGDERERAMCGACDAVVYANPKVVAACVVQFADDRYLLARRAIEPLVGKWGIPQGFMENGETTRDAARREVEEETGFVVVDPLELRAVYNLPNLVQVVYAGRVAGAFAGAPPTAESSEIKAFRFAEIPWEDLAFPTVRWSLEWCEAGAPTVQERTKIFDPDSDQWCLVDDTHPSS